MCDTFIQPPNQKHSMDNFDSKVDFGLFYRFTLKAMQKCIYFEIYLLANGNAIKQLKFIYNLIVGLHCCSGACAMCGA